MSTAEEIKTLYETTSADYAVGCINLIGDLNVGMIVRNAAIFGAAKMFILGRRSYDRRTAVGTQNHIPVDRIFCMYGTQSLELEEKKVIEVLTDPQKIYTLCFVEQSPTSVELNTFCNTVKYTLPLPPLYLFGPEKGGIPSSILDMKDTYTIEIPQPSCIGRSLNVGVASGIVLYAVNN